MKAKDITEEPQSEYVCDRCWENKTAQPDWLCHKCVLELAAQVEQVDKNNRWFG